MSPEPKYPVSATNTSFDVIEALLELEEAGVTELSDEVGIAQSAVHKHLTTLQNRGYVRKVGAKYRLSLRFLYVGGVLRDNSDVYNSARSKLQRLAIETGERVSLLVKEGGMGVYILQVVGDESVNLTTDTHEGKYVHLHNTALGKAVLAWTPKDEVRDIVDEHGLPAETSNTITDLDELFEELERTRERGYAIDDEERIRGIRCVGVPVISSDRDIHAAISLSAPVSRMKGEYFEEEIPEKLQDTANLIELNISY